MNSIDLQLTRATTDGGSTFDTVKIALAPQMFAPPAPVFDLSTSFKAESVLFFEVPVGWVGEWHPTPRNQLYVQTCGALEVTVSTYERRVLEAGDVLWLTDVGGVGHRSEVVGDEPSKGMFIQLPNEERLS